MIRRRFLQFLGLGSAAAAAPAAAEAAAVEPTEAVEDVIAEEQAIRLIAHASFSEPTVRSYGRITARRAR